MFKVDSYSGNQGVKCHAVICETPTHHCRAGPAILLIKKSSAGPVVQRCGLAPAAKSGRCRAEYSYLAQPVDTPMSYYILLVRLISCCLHHDDFTKQQGMSSRANKLHCLVLFLSQASVQSETPRAFHHCVTAWPTARSGTALAIICCLVTTEPYNGP